MKHKINILFFASFLLACFLSKDGFTQAYDSIPVVPSINLSGPRVGVTFIGGELSRELSDWDIQPVITQFGWQFETRFFSLPSGTAGLLEWVLLIGGLEQNAFLPSASCLVGMRTRSGLEFGLGPNLSIAGAAFAFTCGVTLKSNQINFPINLAVVPSSQGTRVGLLVGFNARKK